MERAASIATEFIDSKGKLYSPDFVKLAEACGCYGERITKPQDVRAVLKKAFESGQPAILEAMVPERLCAQRLDKKIRDVGPGADPELPQETVAAAEVAARRQRLGVPRRRLRGAPHPGSNSAPGRRARLHPAAARCKVSPLAVVGASGGGDRRETSRAYDASDLSWTRLSLPACPWSPRSPWTSFSRGLFEPLHSIMAWPS